MPLEYWLTIYFRKFLTSLLWEMKKVVKILIFFSFLIKLSLNRLLTGHWLAFSIYIYIYNLDSSVFTLNNSLATKIKKLDETYDPKLDSN